MKRFAILGLLVLVIIGAVLPAAAAPISDLTQLATYYPANSLVYFSFRTDADLVEELDAVIAQIRETFPNAASDPTLREMLDNAANGLQRGGTYEDTLQPLIGNFGAIGVTSADVMFDADPYNNSAVSYLLVLQLTDGAALEELLVPRLPVDVYSFEDGDGYDLFVPHDWAPEGIPAIYISDSLLAISNKAEALPVSGTPSPSLADSPEFTDALTSLPQDDYGILGYINMTEYFNVAMQAIETRMANSPRQTATDPTGEMMEMLSPMMGDLGGLGMGFTLLDANSLTMDIGVSNNYVASMETMGLTVVTGTPIDPTFAAHIPSGTPLVIQGTNLGGQISANIANFQTQASMMQDATGDAAEELEQALSQIDFGLRGMTGLTLEEATSWMTGNYAISMSFDSDGLMSAMMGGGNDAPFSFGVVIENVDNGANALYDGLAETIDNFSQMLPDNVTVSTMTDVPGNGAGTSIEIDADPSSTPFPVTLQLVVNDDIFAFGTQDFVTQALSGDGGLASDPAYEQAASLGLLDTGLFWYLGAEPLLALVEEMGTMMMGRNDGENLIAVLSAFDSATISGGILADGATQARFVITLGE
jgi:hypothetical protein